MSNSKIPRRFLDLDFNSPDGLFADGIKYTEQKSIADELAEIRQILNNAGFMGAYKAQITQEMLDNNGKCVINHNLNSLYNNITLYDENRQVAYTEIVAKTVNTIEINLKEFMPLTGNWMLIIN
jgi:hypothetical protein